MKTQKKKNLIITMKAINIPVKEIKIYLESNK